jgi:amino acid adenylation domain-containing protein
MKSSENRSSRREVSSSVAGRNQSLVAPLAGHNRFPREWNGNEAPFPRERSVLDFFWARVQSQPESVAIKEGQRLMTYGELDLCSNRVANELYRRGLKPEESVAVFLPASCEFLAAVIGVLKAGGAYLPMDMDIPIKRVEFLLKDSASRLMLSNVADIGRLPEWSGRVLDLAQILSASSPEADKDFNLPSDPNRRAYITYTSGSTGHPKGVEIEHHALTNLVCHYHRRLKLTAQDRASMLAYVAFDGSVADIWPILCAGGTVTIPPKGILLNPDGLIEWLAAEEITLTFVPTGLAEILFARPWPEGIKLRFLITGGDRLRVRPPAGLPFVVLNGYGPTENTVFSTWSVVAPEEETGQTPPIGRPIENTRAYVLDERLQPVSVNVAGELYLGGEQVARGYLGRPELTAERFLSDPFMNKPDARMYRTGDWVRWLDDGELDFLGRKDGQIKIRGWRVELGEIEATLFAHSAIRQVCCVPWLDDGMPSGVIAHIVPDISAAGLSDGLRTYLQARLPDYMVPSEFVLHESLPLTPQGKLDREALMALQAAKPESPQIVTGGDGLEKALASLWHTLVPAAGNSPKDATIAALGGDSLLVIKLMLGVEEITGQRLEVSTFLINPTFAGLCEAVETRMARTEFQPVLALRKHGTRPPLFCLYGVTGDIEAYFNLSEALGDDQPIYGIRSPALGDLSRLPQSMEKAAAEVARYIRKVQPQGDLSLVGYSWAGLLAFEVARQLAKTEGIRCFAALISPDAPMRPTNFTSRLSHFVRYFHIWLWNLITDRRDRGWRLMRWREMVWAIKQNLAEDRLPLEEWGSSPISRHLIGLAEKYHPQPCYDVTIDLFRDDDSYQVKPHPLRAWQTNHLPDGGWNHWVHNPPRIHWLGGDHWTIIKPPLVSSLAQSIRSAIDEHLKQSSPPLENPGNVAR